MNTQIRQQTIDRPSRRLMNRSSQSAGSGINPTATPILTGFYYAVKGEEDQPFSIVQVAQVHNGRVRLCQFAPTFTVLPDFLIPNQLGEPVAQFWLPFDEFASWQPLLMQRGVGDIKL